MTEESFPAGQRILRQGFTGTGFYVILDGEVAIRIDGEERARLSQGRLLRRDVDPARASRRWPTSWPLASCTCCTSAARSWRLPARPPAGHVPDAQDRRPAARQRQPDANLTVAGGLVVGRRPSLPAGRLPGRRRRQRAGRAADQLLPAPAGHRARASSRPTRSPGGMFRRFPFFQRLLSWTKPYAPVARERRASTSGTTGTACWPRSRRTGRSCRAHGRHVVVPVAAGDGARTSRPSPSGPGSRCATTAAGSRPAATASASCCTTSDGDYRCQVADLRGRRRRAVHAADTPGFENVAALRRHAQPPTPTPASGCSSSASRTRGFELATGLLQWAQQIVLASPRPASCRSTRTRWPAVRARYVQPWEDQILGGGVFMLNASIDRRRAHGDAFRVVTRALGGRRRADGRTSTRSSPRPASSARCGTSRTSASTVFGQSQLPSMTNYWESATVPGIYFAGHHRPGRRGHEEVRPPGQLGRRPRRALQRAD